MVKKNEVIEAQIQDVQFPNKGIAIIDGKKIVIKNTLKGQTVKARINKKKGRQIEAKVIETIKKAPYEGEAVCKHFGKCGGCSYQTIAYEDQLKLKSEQVQRLLKEADITDYEYLGIERSPKDFAYRNKMEFTFGDEVKDGELELGMHRRGKFYEIVTVDDCQIVHKDFITILTTFLNYFREKQIPYYKKMTHKGYLRHLVVRKAVKTNEYLINLVTTTQLDFDFTELVDILKNLKLEGQIKGFLHTLNDQLADAVISDETRLIYGQDYITEEILGLKFKITAFSFFQTNSLGAEKLYSIVRDFAGSTKDKVIFDLYSGTGTIGQIMAPIAKEVTGIEIVEEAVESANENTKLNNLNNCKFIAGDVLKKIDELKQKPDIIVLDPPRSGIHPKAIKKIINFNCKNIIYVSCNPKALAEDLKVFKDAGYKIDKIKCMDMFPQTVHIECVSKIVKK
ncbi:23S rRNA (uracil(1939)-C(5))-methyltransferase RlmD [Abyssisolibacter fermentans]|uniref:23S rRNA (uracil(1939)-C(5))-methyltransferase RlmD n=1 Tax=Abyssisolibacter fermentans TaxID=1766203 RepID=UPI00082DA775|nr:23S rRNA (uracil(1939)-C(5))-methyltransferase RlmD [Abyssisolibacter fermentans]